MSQEEWNMMHLTEKRHFMIPRARMQVCTVLLSRLILLCIHNILLLLLLNRVVIFRFKTLLHSTWKTLSLGAAAVSDQIGAFGVLVEIVRAWCPTLAAGLADCSIREVQQQRMSDHPRHVLVRCARHESVSNKRSCWRPVTDTSWQSSARYAGRRSCNALYASTAILNCTRWRTGSQCSCCRTGVMCSHLLVLVTRRALAFWMACRHQNRLLLIL